ncbi:MAG: hypothetical protein WCR24_07135, partial [Candidatus Methanomethylophilaceae archaeon]
MKGIIPELRDGLCKMGNVAVCFSGGLDSTVLLANAIDALPDSHLAVMIDMPILSERQRCAAIRIADFLGTRLITVRLSWKDLVELMDNGPERCYYCKKAIYSNVRRVAEEHGFTNIAAGENIDDKETERPGRRAGTEESIINPLLDLGIGRSVIEETVKKMGLPVCMIKDTCMATRFPTDMPIDEEKVRMAEDCERTIRMNTGVRQLRIKFREEEAVLLTDPD